MFSIWLQLFTILCQRFRTVYKRFTMCRWRFQRIRGRPLRIICFYLVATFYDTLPTFSTGLQTVYNVSLALSAHQRAPKPPNATPAATPQPSAHFNKIIVVHHLWKVRNPRQHLANYCPTRTIDYNNCWLQRFAILCQRFRTVHKRFAMVCWRVQRIRVTCCHATFLPSTSQ